MLILCDEYDVGYTKVLISYGRLTEQDLFLLIQLELKGISVDYSSLKVYEKYYNGVNNNFYIKNISNARTGKVTISIMHPHSCQDGDFVCISEAEGMKEAYGIEERSSKYRPIPFHNREHSSLQSNFHNF